MDPVRLWLGTYPSSDDAPEQPSGVRRVAVHPDGVAFVVGEDLVLVASQGDACLVAVRVAEDGAGEVVGRLDLPVKPSCIVVD